MRFVPPVAALADAPVEFDGDPGHASARSRRSWRPFAGSGAAIDDGGPAPPVHRPRHGIGAPAAGHPRRVGLLPVRLRPAARRPRVSTRASRSATAAAGFRPAPHIAMTVAVLRDAGADVESAGGRHDGRGGAADTWRVHPGPIRPGATRRRARPVQRRPLPGGRTGHRGHGDHPRLAAATTQPATPCVDLLGRMGGRRRAHGDGGLTVTGTGTSTGVTADLSDVGELASVLAALAALADSPSRLPGIAHIRGHETDRLAALATELDALGGDVTELPDGLRSGPRPLHGGRLRTATPITGWRWPPPCSGSPSTASTSRIAATGQDLPGVHRACGRRAGEGAPGEPGGHAGLTRTSTGAPATRFPAPHQGAGRAHEDAVEGFVATVDRGRYAVLVDGRRVTAMKARELGRRGVVVGDRVAPGRRRVRRRGHAGPDRAGAAERSTVLRRTADDDDPVERVIVANADQLVVVTALADPSRGPGSSTGPWSPPSTRGCARCCA